MCCSSIPSSTFPPPYRVEIAQEFPPPHYRTNLGVGRPSLPVYAFRHATCGAPGRGGTQTPASPTSLVSFMDSSRGRSRARGSAFGRSQHPFVTSGSGGGRGGRAPAGQVGLEAVAFDCSEGDAALAAVRTMLRNPPPAVEDDAPSQAWLEGLTAMTDYVLWCHGAAPVAWGQPSPTSGGSTSRGPHPKRSKSDPGRGQSARRHRRSR